MMGCLWGIAGVDILQISTLITTYYYLLLRHDRENGHQNFPIFSLAGWVKLA